MVYRRCVLACAIAGLAHLHCEPGAHVPPSDARSAETSHSQPDPVVARAHREEAATAAADARFDVDMAARSPADRPCEDLALKECQADCDGGKLPACVHLAEIYMHGQRVPRDFDHGGTLLREACEAGSVKGCYEHGLYFQARDPVKAAESLIKVCSGDGAYAPASCSMVLTMVDRHTIAPSRDDLIAVLRRACELEKTPSGPAPRGACDRLKDVDDTP
jgi:TPR repeat protein